jgi:chaperonin GroES
MQVIPLHDRVLLSRIDDTPLKTEAGIHIPETAKEKPMKALVVAVGTGRVTDEGSILPLDVRVGDTILMGKYSGTDIKIDDQEYVIMREGEILAIIRK